MGEDGKWRVALRWMCVRVRVVDSLFDLRFEVDERSEKKKRGRRRKKGKEGPQPTKGKRKKRKKKDLASQKPTMRLIKRNFAT